MSVTGADLRHSCSNRQLQGSLRPFHGSRVSPRIHQHRSGPDLIPAAAQLFLVLCRPPRLGAFPSTPPLLCSPCSYPVGGLGSATNSPELPKLPLSRKHRGQRTTNVTGTTPAMSLSALCFRHGMQKPLSGCGCSDFSWWPVLISGILVSVAVWQSRFAPGLSPAQAFPLYSTGSSASACAFTNTEAGRC